MDAQNLGIPYAESFYVSSVYCLNRVSANECRFKCHATLVFRKNLWGIVKSERTFSCIGPHVNYNVSTISNPVLLNDFGLFREQGEWRGGVGNTSEISEKEF